MNLHIQLTPTQATLIAAQKARDARKRALAYKGPHAEPERPKPVYRPFYAIKIPAWKNEECHFDYHMTLWGYWKVEQSFIAHCSSRQYIKHRAEQLGFAFQQIVGPSRKKKLTYARQTIMWEIKTTLRPTISFPELGRLFGGRDHTTCLHAFRKIDAEKARAAGI